MNEWYELSGKQEYGLGTFVDTFGDEKVEIRLYDASKNGLLGLKLGQPKVINKKSLNGEFWRGIWNSPAPPL